MGLEALLIDLEKRFWKGDADFYRQHVARNSLMVFPEPVGMLEREETIDAIASGPRWTEVEFEKASVIRLTGESAIVAYKATAHRGEDVYTTLASSAYVQEDGSWKLAFHQQTPDTSGGSRGD
jgi:hypothetical protein